MPTASGMQYLITGPQPRGKFLADKALELGIPKGPLLGKLSRGESIEFNG